MTSDLFESVEKSTRELEETAREVMSAIRVLFVLIRDPRGLVANDVSGCPTMEQMKRGLNTLNNALERAQRIVGRMIDKVTAQAGNTRLLIDEVQSEK